MTNKSRLLELSEFYRSLTYVELIESVCQIEGEPVKLYNWQRVFWEAVQEYQDQLDTAAVSLFKKFGKSANTAFGIIARTLKVPGSLHLIHANSKDQAKNIVYRVCKQFFEDDSVWAKHTLIKQGELIIEPLDTRIQTVSNRAGSVAGRNHITLCSTETAYVTNPLDVLAFEELALPPTGAYGVQPLRLLDSYAEISGKGNVWRRIVDHGLAGECLDPTYGLWLNEGTLLMHQDGVDARQRLWPHDEKTYKRYYEAQEIALDDGSYARLHKNIPAQAKSDFDATLWRKLATPEIELLAPTQDVACYGGVDIAIAASGDSAVAILWYLHESGFVVPAAYKEWKAADRLEELDLTEVEKWIIDHNAGYNVVSWAFDSYQFKRSAQYLRRKGVPMMEFKQSLEKLGPAGARLMRGIREQRLRIPEIPDLVNMMDHVAVESVAQGLHWKKAANSPVDLAVATLMAVQPLLDFEVPMSLQDLEKEFGSLSRNSNWSGRTWEHPTNKKGQSRFKDFGR